MLFRVIVNKNRRSQEPTVVALANAVGSAASRAGAFATAMRVITSSFAMTDLLVSCTQGWARILCHPVGGSRLTTQLAGVVDEPQSSDQLFEMCPIHARPDVIQTLLPRDGQIGELIGPRTTFRTVADVAAI